MKHLVCLIWTFPESLLCRCHPPQCQTLPVISSTILKRFLLLMFTRKDTCCLNQHCIKVVLMHHVAFGARFSPPCSVHLLVWRRKAGEKVPIALFNQFGLLNTEIVLAQAIAFGVVWPQWLEQDWKKQKRWEKDWMTFLHSSSFFHYVFPYFSPLQQKERGGMWGVCHACPHLDSCWWWYSTLSTSPWSWSIR